MADAKPDYWIENRKGYARTIDLACLMVGVSDRTYKQWMTQGCPGEPGRYCPSEIVAWARDNKWSVDVGDPELAGGDSPALERYRDEKAKLARLDRLERERELVKIDDIHEALTAVSNLFRGAGEQLRRQFGNEALTILDEAIDEAERLVDGIGGDGD